MRVAIGSFVVGFVLITIGFYLAYHPLGFIFPGALLIAAAVKNTRGTK